MALPRARRHPAPARAGAPAALRNRCERRPPVSWVPPGPSGHRRRGPLAALAAAVLLAGAACSTTGTTEAGDGARATTTATSPATTTRPGATAPPSTTATSTAPAATDDEAAVLAAYQGFWDTWLQANDPPNPNHPGLERYYTGPALEKARAEIEKNRQAGLALQRPADSKFGYREPTIELSGSSAVLRTCLVDDGLVVIQSSGAIVDATVVNSDLEAHLTKSADSDGATWRVSENRFVEKRTGPKCP
ncbi:MAG: hypothetical protein U0Q07_01605 [Acidimicrobiales bacterium]